MVYGLQGRACWTVSTQLRRTVDLDTLSFDARSLVQLVFTACTSSLQLIYVDSGRKKLAIFVSLSHCMKY